MQGMKIKIKPKVIPLEDEILGKVFPADRFYGVYLPRWPVAVRPPKELSYETVVDIRRGESVEPIRDDEALRTFLGQTLSGVTDEVHARAAVLASLRLAAALAKGAPYRLESPEISVVRQENHLIATALAAVRQPGRGDITIRMQFGGDGKIALDAIKIDGRARPGPP